MNKLSEEMKLPKVDANDLPEVKEAELPKEVEEERDIHGDDGEQKRPEAEEIKKESEDAAKDELSNREKVIADEINGAETPKAMANNGEGKNVKLKGLTEKLTLEEPSDVLNEDVNEVIIEPWKKVEMLINDMGIRPEDIIEHMIQWLPSDELKDCINDFIVDNDLEDEFDFVAEDFPSSALDEAIPRDLAKSYRRAAYQGNLGANTDLQNSDYKELTPEEAKEIYKKDPTSIKLLLDGQLIDFRSNGKPSLTHRDQWVDDEKAYRRSSGKTIRDTRRMPVSHLFKIADKIYQAKEVEKDQDVLRNRSMNPESPRYRGDGFLDSSNFSGYRIRGSRRPDMSDKRYYQRRVKELEDSLNELERIKDEMDPEAYEIRKKGLVDRVKDCESEIKKIDDTNSDYLARKRYTDAEKSLKEPYNKFKEIKDQLRGMDSRLENAKDRLESIKQNGSEATRNTKNEIEYKIKRIEELQRELDILNLQLEGSDEDDAEALAAAENQYKNILANSKDLTSQLNRLLGR